jgi:hypothetical protein
MIVGELTFENVVELSASEQVRLVGLVPFAAGGTGRD